MVINVYNRDLELQGAVDEIGCLIWKRRYWSCGEFSLLIPAKERHIALMADGNLIIPQGYDEGGEIKFVNITQDIDGIEQIEVQGKFLSSWVGKRIIRHQIIETASPESLMLKIVRDNVTDPNDQNRKIPQLIAGPEPDSESLAEYASGMFANVLDEIEMIAGSAEVGFKTISDIKDATNTFAVYSGRDLSVDNADGNPPCVFAREYDNVLSQNYTHSTENKRTTAYVGGEPVEDAARLIIEIGDDKTGLDRDEVFVDAHDISRKYVDENNQTVTIEESEYENLVRQRGQSELARYTETLGFDSRVNPGASLKYREDFDVGDIVTCIDKKWGIKMNTRITEVTETYQPGREEIEVVFGEPLPTLSEKIKQIRR